MTIQRLAFLCGSAVPAKDGVGDYCRIFQAECQRLGIESLIIALNDKSARSVSDSPGGSLLLPASLPWEKRTALAQDRLNDFEPDWTSLQFVPFSFNPKGIIRSEISHLSSMTRAKRIHVMMHELWLGIAASESLKRKVTGWLQKRCILHLLRNIRPAAIHTSNLGYANAMQRCGFPAKVLPIPSNIPISDPSNQRIKSADLRRSLSHPQDTCLAVVFGTIHPQWNPTELLEWLVEELSRENSRLRILIMGRSGPAAATLASKLPPDLASRLDIDLIGELEAGDISLCLQHSAFGLSSMPLGLLGKSGTHAAMTEHGLPVITTRDDWRPLGQASKPPQDSLTFHFHPSRPLSLAALRNAKRPPRSRTREIVERFVRDLDLVTSKP